MANGNITISLHHKTTYHAVFIPFASKETCGDITVLRIFGLPVYERVGGAKRILGFSFKGLA